MSTKQPMEAPAVCALPTRSLSAVLRSSHEWIARLFIIHLILAISLTLYFLPEITFQSS